MFSKIITKAIIAILPRLSSFDLCEIRHFANETRITRLEG